MKRISIFLRSVTVLLVITTLLHSSCPAQDNIDHELILKYWYYRERLSHFVVPGLKMGESELAGVRNRFGIPEVVDFGNIDFGQHGVYFGYYLGILATEYAFLKGQGLDDQAHETGVQVLWALNQFVQYMDECEHYWYKPDDWDGFFIRNSVPWDFLDDNSFNGVDLGGDPHSEQLNIGLTDENYYLSAEHRIKGVQDGHPGWVKHFSTYNVLGSIVTMPEPMSIDEGIGVLMGLALVMFNMEDFDMFLVPSSQMTVKMTAKECGKKIVWNMYHDGLWYIVNPETGDPLWGTGNYSYGIAKVGEYFGMPWGFQFPLGELEAKAQWYATPFANGVVYNDVMEATLGAIGNSWSDLGTPYCIGEAVGGYYTHTFYSILFDALHYGTMYQNDIYSLMKLQLYDAPGEGPYNFGHPYHPSGGWAYTYKWRGDYPEQMLGSTLGVFSGVDYLLGYNMYAGGRYFLLHELLAKDYHPYNSFILSETFPVLDINNQIIGGNEYPYNVVVMKDIVLSTQKILKTTTVDYQQNQLLTPINEPGNVNYLAGESIYLGPGFKVELGAKFHCAISNPIIWESFSQNSTDPYEVPSTHVYDALEYSKRQNDYTGNYIAETAQRGGENINVFKEDNDNRPLRPANGNETLEIYPNPFVSSFTVDFPGIISDHSKCYIFDIYSNLVLSKELNSNSISFNCESLTPGTYVIKFVNDNICLSYKIVKI